MITLGALNDLTGIRHGFLTRRDGVSTGPFASLNCGFGSGDEPRAVAENRARAARRMGSDPARLVTAHQVHGIACVEVETPWSREAAPEADAMVTRVPGITLGILTADCAPVLLADPDARVVGAAHAGWRSALGGVVEATVARMVALGARAGNISAVIGPRIGRRSYEVGPEFPAPFLEQDAENAMFFDRAPRDGKFLFDISGYLARRLRSVGVVTVQSCPNDTLVEEERFFSWRRASLRGETRYGRQLSAIRLAD